MVRGGIIRGERDERQGSTGEFGHGIYIEN
jgi:hypothetical protein